LKVFNILLEMAAVSTFRVWAKISETKTGCFQIFNILKWGDIRKVFHTILENRNFVTDPQTPVPENQKGPLDNSVPLKITPKSRKIGVAPAKNGSPSYSSPLWLIRAVLICASLSLTTEMIACAWGKVFLIGIFDFLHLDPHVSFDNVTPLILIVNFTIILGTQLQLC
jgi:hypothetical protein